MDYNARYYSSYLARFISPDSIVPEPGDPQNWNKYTYVGSNPIRYTDSTGHCKEVGDESCWSKYEEIQRKCPDCDTGWTDGAPLYEKNYEQLSLYSDLYDDAQTRPVPEEAIDAALIAVTTSSDAVVIGLNAGATPPGGTQGPTLGLEAVMNDFDDTSIFYYDGVTAGPGAGGSLSPYGGLVWNLETNADYKGDFASLSATLTVGQGGTATVFWAPDFTADKPFGFAIGPATGVEVSILYSSTFYKELLTNRGR